MSGHSHTRAQLLTRAHTHTHRLKFTNQKCISWRPTPKRNPAGRNWNNLLAYKFSLTVSPRLFISVIEKVSNVAKLTKSNSFDQKMNLARLSVCARPGGGRETNKTETRETERGGLRSDQTGEGEAQLASEIKMRQRDGGGGGEKSKLGKKKSRNDPAFLFPPPRKSRNSLWVECRTL